MVDAASMRKRGLAGLRIDGHAADGITNDRVGGFLPSMAAMAMIIAMGVTVMVVVFHVHAYLLCPKGSWRDLSTFQQLEGQVLISARLIFRRPPLASGAGGGFT
jgi:hypothetical protein